MLKKNILVSSYITGPLVYFIEGRSPSRHKRTEVLHLVGALLEHFLEESSSVKEETLFVYVVTK